MVKTVKKDDFYRQMFKLAIPIIIQNLLSAAVNSSDVIMLNYVGQSAISAVSLAANYSNILFMVYYGLGTGASLLCAQYFGKKNMQAIHAVEGIALRFSLAISALVALAAFTMPQRMLLLFTSDQELIAIGSSYIRIMGITYLCWGVTEIYLAILRSIGRVTISMTLNMLAFGLNILLNARFYFWTVWGTEAWSDRCGDRNGIFQADTTHCLRDRIFVEQRCKTESSLYVYPEARRC